MSAFMMFSNKNRESVKEKNPEATFGEMGKLIGAKWKVGCPPMPCCWKNAIDGQKK
jgi:hypothetical protein